MRLLLKSSPLDDGTTNIKLLPELVEDGPGVGVSSGRVSESQEPVVDERGDDRRPSAEHEDDNLKWNEKLLKLAFWSRD